MTKSKSVEQLLTLQEATAYLRERYGVHVDPQTVRKWAQRELIDAVRTPSGRYLFAASALDEAMRRE